MTGDMRISVIVPCHNAGRWIGAALRSTAAQTYAPHEVIVVDDDSTDDSVRQIESSGVSVTLRRGRWRNAAAARNAGIEAAQGSHLAFLDSDDRWYPDKLERQLARMHATGARLSYASYRRVDEGDRALSVVRPPAEIDYAAMLKSNRIGNLTGLYDRSLGDARFRKVGHEDYVFWLEMMRRAGRGVRADDGEPLADYLVRAGSLSSDKLRAAGWQWRIYRDIERLDVARAAWYFAHYAGNAIAKRR